MSETIVRSALHHLLLVESDSRDADGIVRALRGCRSVRVNLLRDVVHAMHFLSKRDTYLSAPTPDLILIDLHLRYFSGAALLEERRRRPAWATIPLVVLSETPDDRIACLAHGADGHVVKPPDVSGWRRVLGDVFGRHLPLAERP